MKRNSCEFSVSFIRRRSGSSPPPVQSSEPLNRGREVPCVIAPAVRTSLYGLTSGLWFTALYWGDEPWTERRTDRSAGPGAIADHPERSLSPQFPHQGTEGDPCEAPAGARTRAAAAPTAPIRAAKQGP